MKNFICSQKHLIGTQKNWMEQLAVHALDTQ